MHTWGYETKNQNLYLYFNLTFACVPRVGVPVRGGACVGAVGGREAAIEAGRAGASVDAARVPVPHAVQYGAAGVVGGRVEALL